MISDVDLRPTDGVGEMVDAALESRDLGSALRFLLRCSSGRSAELTQALVDRSVAELTRASRRSFWIAFTARAAARQAGNDLRLRTGGRAEVVCTFRMARALLFLRRMRGALRLLDRCARASLADGDLSGVAALQADRIFALSHLERFEEAESAAHEALAQAEADGNDRLQLAILHSLGVMASRRERFRDALHWYGRCRVITERLQRPTSSLDANAARCLEALHRFRAARRYFERAREAHQRRGNRQEVAQVDYNRAYMALLRGRYAEALTLFDAAEQVFLELGDGHHVAQVDLDRAELYLQMGMPAEARGQLLRAIPVLEKVALPKERAQALFFLAVAELLEGRVAAAEYAFGDARLSFVDLEYWAWVAECDLLLARAALERDDSAVAIRLANDARDRFATSGFPVRAAASELVVARALLDAGDLSAVAESLADAGARLRPLEVPWVELELDRLEGLRLLAAGDRPEGIRSLERAVDLLERRRGAVPPDEFMVAFLASKAAVYAEIIEALVGEGRGEDAFEYSERARSRALVDMLSARDGRHLRPTGRLRDARVQRLREEVNGLYSRAHRLGLGEDQPSAEAQERLRRQLLGRERVLTDLLRDGRSRVQEHRALDSVSVPALADVQALLRPDTTLLEFFVTADRTHAFVVTRDGFTVRSLDIGEAELGQRARRFRFHLSREVPGTARSARAAATNLAATRDNLLALYRALLEPLSDLLSHRRLVVVPHGTLHAVPFHALATDDDGWLCERHDVSYAPSAAVYGHALRLPVRASGPPCVLAVPDPAAPAILAEAEAVAAALGPDAVCVVGASVTETRLREAATTSRILHFATHGMYRHDHPMLSGIRLAGGRWLNLYDIYDLDVRADLVVLSACETGVARVTRGDELLGLLRGFLFAGAPRLLCSQWRVGDAATATFMEVFYGSCREGRSYGESLRAAMAAVRAEDPHPYHWAPFLLVGDPDPPVRPREVDGPAVAS